MIPFEKASQYGEMLKYSLDREKYAGLKDISEYSGTCPEKKADGLALFRDTRDYLSSEELESDR